MQNLDLAADYVRRAHARLGAVDALFERESWADVVRESQGVVELALTGLLRAHGVEPPRLHDLSDVLVAEQARLPAPVRQDLDRLVDASRTLRRDRELAYYGAEDLTPSDFYTCRPSHPDCSQRYMRNLCATGNRRRRTSGGRK